MRRNIFCFDYIMVQEFFMHDLHRDKLKQEFHENKRTPEEIIELFRAIDFSLPLKMAERLSLLSEGEDLRKNRNTHFQDAVEISEIIDDLMGEEISGAELNELRAACLFHDIGKSGPIEADQEEQQAFVDLFNIDFDQREYETEFGKKIPAELPLIVALEIKVKEGDLTAGRAEEILRLILAASSRQKDLRLPARLSRKSTMGMFWSGHVYWTDQILQAEKVNEEIRKVAVSHHLLDGHDPAQIGFENVDAKIASLELADKYQAFRVRLILADKYQALRKRSALTHEQTIVILQKMIREKLAGQEAVISVYEKVLQTIDRHKALFEKELELA